MSEVIPRWNMPEVSFVEADPSKVEAALITGYEQVAGRTLAAGDPIRLFLLSIAAEIIQLRQGINFAGQQNLLTYARGEYLDALGESIAVSRLPASKAITTIQFTLTQALGNAYTIPKGFQVSAGSVAFETDQELIIPIGERTGEVTASCVESGTVGNGFVAGQITTIVVPQPYLESASNTVESIGGSEIEDDASYAERIRLRPDSFSVAGPEKSYEYFTKSYSSSIIDVAITSPDPGEVYVYPLLDGGQLPNESFLEGLLAHLSDETIRPLTDHVVTKSPTAVNYKIQLDYWVNQSDSTRLAAIQSAVEEAVENYRLWQQSKIGRDISQDELISYVIAAGASRIDRTTLSPASFQSLSAEQVAQCTEVKVNFKGYKDE